MFLKKSKAYNYYVLYSVRCNGTRPSFCTVVCLYNILHLCYRYLHTDLLNFFCVKHTNKNVKNAIL